MSRNLTGAGCALLLMLAACSGAGDEVAAESADDTPATAAPEAESADNDAGPGGNLFAGFDIDPSEAEALTGEVETALTDALDWDIVNMELRHAGNGVYIGQVVYLSDGTELDISCITELAEGSTAGNVTLTGHMCPAPDPTG